MNFKSVIKVFVISILSITLIAISIYIFINFNIHIENKTTQVSGSQGVQTGDNSVQNNNFFNGVFNAPIDEEDFLYGQIARDLGCTYNLIKGNEYSYECPFRSLAVVRDKDTKNLLTNFPNGKRAFIPFLPANIKLIVGLCNLNGSKCTIFDNFSYKWQNKTCIVTTPLEWFQNDVGFKEEIC